MIWFDLGNTLVYVRREEIYQKKLIEIGVHKTIADLHMAFHLTDKYFMREHPGLLGKRYEVFAEDYYQTLHQHLNITMEQMPQALISPYDPSQPKGEWEAFPETIPTLAALKEKGFGIGLISNWNNTARDVLEKTGIMPYLDEVVISSELQIEKPDERIFTYALQQAKVRAEDCVYVGDNYYDDVIGSGKVGMACVLINPYGRTGIEEVNHESIITGIGELLSALEPKLASRTE
ncbi:HAD family hydrolase [Litoribacterium kuwaitense]|uniref:HAD family hydrolase n=1 Tax=Litoribacterium kuwaitense TaxID=1398745 RepID=UPI001FED0C46|nr:HAD-IA family hydrolase [Litoribacterium kuwaitense]